MAPDPSGASAAVPSHLTTIHVGPTKQLTPEDFGDSLEARRHYQAAIAAYAKDPNPSAAVWNKMGVSYQMMYNFKQAARCYKASLKLDPHNAVVLNNLGSLYNVRKNYKRAERMYRRALKYRSSLQGSHTSALIFKNLGTVLLARGKYDEGWEAYRKAVTLEPGIFADATGPSSAAPASVHQNGAVNYFMARGCARARRIKCAVRYLRLALDEGFTTVKKVAWSSDFTNLRKSSAFHKLLAEEKKQKP